METPTPSQFFQDFIQNSHSRKLLQYFPLNHPEVPAASPNPGSIGASISTSGFQRDAIVILSVLICAVLFSLGMLSIIKSALKCTSFLSVDSGSNLSEKSANQGVKQKVLKTFPIVKYSDDQCKVAESLDKECVICLNEFAPGENLRILPKCNHGFHVLCIDKWFSSHSSCPTCRDNVIEKSQKISQSSSSVVPSSTAEEHLKKHRILFLLLSLMF